MVVGLVGGTLGVFLIPWTAMLVVGAVTLAAGLVFGVATGFWYHVELARGVSAKTTLPARWWLRPVELHEWLDPASHRRVMPWFYAGAVGFVITVVGLVLIALGLAGGALRPS